MRRSSLWAFVCLVCLALATVSSGAAERARETPRSASCVLVAELRGIVNPGTADYLGDAVRAAAADGCVLLVTLDTPGGAVESTRKIVQAFLNAPVPVIVYVAPGGARAGSAGVFITLAAHIAVMAPGSTIGAAHPVLGGGQDIEKAGGEHLAAKVLSDTAALARSIAQQRGRNVEWAERAVRESVSATAAEAERLRVVDLQASSRRELLRAVDGRTVRVAGGEVRLATANAAVRRYPMTIQQRARDVLGNPNLTYALLMLGILGIMIEIYSPGLIVPGVAGALALLLAAIGLDYLPVNIGGVALIVVGVGMLVAELFTTSFGLLTAGGLVCLLAGSALMLDRSSPDFFADPSVRLSWAAVAPLALLLASAAGALAWKARRARCRPSPTGSEGLIGATGTTVTQVDPQGGCVRVHGERWRATAAEPIAPGATVRILAVRGLELQVTRTEPSPSRQAP